MLTILIIGGVYAAVRVGIAAARSLRDLPHSNDDMVFF
jgi:hypothetical protein